MMKSSYTLMLVVLALSNVFCQNPRPRDLGIEFGIFDTGPTNTIIDVPGVRVGHQTKVEGESVRTGVTAIIPHPGDVFQLKCPGTIYIGNGFGKLAGYSQVEELGAIETPIVLTNTLSVGTAVEALVKHTLSQPGNEKIRSVNAVVGETNDGSLNDIRGMHVSEKDIFSALENATANPPAEGNVGAGTGTVCFGFKGGIGTASRKLPESMGNYTIGVLVQSNFGGVLEIAGVPIGKEMGRYPYKEALDNADGSCMIVVITNAPVSARNLKRMAKRALFGLAKTGGIGSNGSGDYVIALSNYPGNLIPYQSENKQEDVEFLRNDQMTPLFMATIEAAEEAIINSLFAAQTMTGNGNTVEALPVNRVLEIMQKYGRLKP